MVATDHIVWGDMAPVAAGMRQSLLATVNMPKYVVRCVAGNRYVGVLGLSSGFSDCRTILGFITVGIITVWCFNSHYSFSI